MEAEAKGVRFVLSAQTLGPFDSEVSAFIVEITPKDARHYLTLIDEADRLNKRRGGLAHLDFYDYSGDYYSVCPEEVSDADLPDPIRTDVCCVVVDEKHIYWTAYLKHSDVPVETDPIKRHQLEKVVEAKE